MKHLYFFLVIGFFFASQKSISQGGDKEVIAKIEIEQVENILFIKGTVENLKPEYKSIYYKLTVFKNNRLNGNNSKNSQDGRVILNPQQKVALSKTQINESKDDTIILLLVIFDENNAVIGKDRIEIGVDGKEDKDLKNQPKDGLELKGIVSNDTKTKLGNDFYELFYTEYSKLKLGVNKIVVIQEELTFGRTTKILVVIDGETIYEFISRPDQDYLKFMSEYISAEVFKYFKNLEKQKISILKY